MLRQKGRDCLFLPEKHLLINKIKETSKACELKRLKCSDTNEIFITDYTSAKDVQAQFVTIATILNEKGKNDITNVKVLSCKSTNVSLLSKTRH